MVHIKSYNPRTDEVILINKETSQELSLIISKSLSLDEKQALINSVKWDASKQNLLSPEKEPVKPQVLVDQTPIKNGIFKRIAMWLWRV